MVKGSTSHWLSFTVAPRCCLSMDAVCCEEAQLYAGLLLPTALQRRYAAPAEL